MNAAAPRPQQLNCKSPRHQKTPYKVVAAVLQEKSTSVIFLLPSPWTIPAVSSSSHWQMSRHQLKLPPWHTSRKGYLSQRLKTAVPLQAAQSRAVVLAMLELPYDPSGQQPAMLWQATQ
ncbi:hypothetical protein V5799_031441 [Amblyomma americanum]|uniref:Uncharacterized protein n=1 Tax=Amblyomma americanum TaxID=6943 RepID=A0AAQ4EKF5_AMBAM